MATIQKVDDHGLETIRKAGMIPDDTTPTQYAIRSTLVDESNNAISVDSNNALKVNPVDDSGNSITVNADGQLKVVLDGKVDDGNSSSTPLLAGAEFTGVAVDTLDYAIIFVTIYSDVASATDGFHLDISSDGITWRQGDVYTIAAATEKTFSFQPNKRYIRTHYINGGTNQTIFDMQTILKKSNCKPSSHSINSPTILHDDAELVKAVITGQNPAGLFINFKSTTSGNFKVSLEELENTVSVNGNSQLRTTQFDSSGNELGVEGTPLRVDFPGTYFDAFGRLATAAPFKLIEYSATHPIDTIRYHDTAVVGSATVTRNATKSQIELTTTTASGDKATFQTRRNIQYNKANAQEIFIIYRPNPITNRRERWGYFDDNNGIYFEHDGTVPRLVIRSNTSGGIVNTTIERAAWDDALDGNGPSGLTIDFTKQTIFKIDFGWLSSRGCRFLIDVSGQFVLVKQYYISNTLAVPFMAQPQLPIRFEVENTAATSGTTISSFTCYAVQSSGSDVQEGYLRIRDTGVTAHSISATETFPLGFRLNSNFLNASFQFQRLKLQSVTGTDYLYFKIIYNPTLTGATWAAGEGGAFDYLTALTSYTGGSVIESGYLALANKNQAGALDITELKPDIYLGKSIAGVSDNILIVFRTNTGSGSIFYSSQIKEYL